MPKSQSTTVKSPIGDANEAQSNSAFSANDVALESWLQNEVAPVYDAHKANPSRAVALDDAMTNVRKRIARNAIII
ncbi:hypothetical protein H009_15743 [Agrobacterium tumefaciens str. Cherry 2E-2-2]|nr:hypothetical protein H009_15743 [Agrobacterium tumefaciens str. Cherry 2E-2-2]